MFPALISVFKILHLCSYLISVKSEVFTSTSELVQSVESEGKLLDLLDEYIIAEQQKIDFLRQYQQIQQSQHDEAAADPGRFVANPMNAYRLIKRLVVDWDNLEDLVKRNTPNFVKAIANIRETAQFPGYEDLSGAAVAVARLQDMYELETASLAKGEVKGVHYSAELSTDDCIQLGKDTYFVDDFYHSALWMTEARSRLGNDTNSNRKMIEVLDFLAFSTYKLGDTVKALEMTNKLLEIMPEDHEDFDRNSGNKLNYEYELSLGYTSKEAKKINEIQYNNLTQKQLHMRRMCRGDISRTPQQTASLKCRFAHNNIPFLFLAPFKVEEIHYNPDILVYHDILDDAEIEVMKNLATPKFRRAYVYKNGTGKTASFRISKTAWLEETQQPLVQRINQRVADMTDLDMVSAEALQVCNYGLGGHYDEHYDFARKTRKVSYEAPYFGNRIATVILYMSDVDMGGATIFPLINVTIWPEKGKALFWYNLHRSGDGNVFTEHMACPVLIGSKWITTKWLHESGQEFRRPCTLERPNESDIA